MKATLLVFLTLLNMQGEAVPSFARNLGIDCSVCHTDYPQLTEFGKIFLETGGDLLIQKKYGNLTMTPSNFSGHGHLLPIDDTISEDATTRLTRNQEQLKLRASQEINAYICGRMGKAFFFNVLAATDDKGFSMRFDEGFVMYRLLENLSIFGGWDSPFIPDGNDTVQHHTVLNRQWKAVDYTPQQSQMLGVNGLYKNFWWIAAWNAGTDALEGNDPKGINLRAAYTAYHQTVGVYFCHDYDFDNGSFRSVDPFYLYGVDGHFRFAQSNILMVCGLRKKQGRKLDFDVSVEANKIFSIQDTTHRIITSIIPIANVDVYIDRDVSSALWVAGSIGIALYVNPGVRFLPQYSATLVAPDKYVHQEMRFLISADLGF